MTNSNYFTLCWPAGKYCYRVFTRIPERVWLLYRRKIAATMLTSANSGSKTQLNHLLKSVN